MTRSNKPYVIRTVVKWEPASMRDKRGHLRTAAWKKLECGHEVVVFHGWRDDLIIDGVSKARCYQCGESSSHSD